MKKLLLKFVLRDKFVGQIASAAASAAAAWLVSLIPGAPELVITILRSVLEVPQGTEITAAGVTVMLTPVIYSVLSAVVQEMVSKDANVVLNQLKDAGVYSGPIDGWVGPIASEGVEKLVLNDTFK